MHRVKENPSPLYERNGIYELYFSRKFSLQRCLCKVLTFISCTLSLLQNVVHHSHTFLGDGFAQLTTTEEREHERRKKNNKNPGLI